MEEREPKETLAIWDDSFVAVHSAAGVEGCVKAQVVDKKKKSAQAKASALIRDKALAARGRGSDAGLRGETPLPFPNSDRQTDERLSV